MPTGNGKGSRRTDLRKVLRGPGRRWRNVVFPSPSDEETVTVARVRVAGETEPGASVRVNSIAVEPEADGSFRLILALTPGNSTLTAVATDLAGNSGSTSVSRTYNDPAPGLQQDLDDLQTQIFILIGLLVAALALAGVLFFLYWNLRQEGSP